MRLEPGIPYPVALIGAGSVGTAVAELLRRAGHPIVGVSSRSEVSARRAAELLDTRVFDHQRDLPEDTMVVLIGVPDGAIEDVVRALRHRPPVVAWHLAGARGIHPLSPVVKAGGGAVALHPVQACPDVNMALQRLPGSAWGMTCSEGLDAWAGWLVSEALDGRPVSVAEGERARWHAAAAVTSNGIAALLSVGERLLASIGVERAEGVLGPLAAGTVANAREAGGGAATLTGPVARGDVSTVRRHLDALAGSPELLEPYRGVARLILENALAGGRLEGAQADAMARLLTP